MRFENTSNCVVYNRYFIKKRKYGFKGIWNVPRLQSAAGVWQQRRCPGHDESESSANTLADVEGVTEMHLLKQQNSITNTNP